MKLVTCNFLKLHVVYQCLSLKYNYIEKSIVCFVITKTIPSRLAQKEVVKKKGEALALRRNLLRPVVEMSRLINKKFTYFT